MCERFSNEIGCHFEPEWLLSLSNEGLAMAIRTSESWDADLNRELCWRADMAEEWENADESNFESVVYAAAEKLGVEI